MPTPHDYIDAINAFHSADREVKMIVARLKSFVERLSEFPGETCFADIEDEPEPPLGQLISGARWYAAEFPSPATIQSAIRRRHDTRAACERIAAELTPRQLRGAPPIPH